MAKKKKNKFDRYIESLHDIRDKLVIITGANSGLGYEMARVALLKGAHLIMACRNKERAEKAKESLINETGNKNIEIELYDQSDLKSVHSFASLIQSKYQNFYALVLNAGIFLPTETLDEFKISNVYRTNFIGALVLLEDLNNFISQSESERRIIIQGSVASFFNKYKNKDKFIYGIYSPFKQYALSKLCCSNLFIYHRDNNHNPYVKYLLCEPGIATTGLFKNFKKWFKNLSAPFLIIIGNSSRAGSLSGCKLLCDIASNGDYYRPRHLFTAKGLPKKGHYPKKYIFSNIIKDGLEIAEQYEQSEQR